MAKKLIFLLFLFCSKIGFAQESDDFPDDEFAAFEESFSTDDSQIYDPFEKVNRKIFYVNDKLDVYIFEPAAKGYRDFTPKTFRNSIRNFIVNLSLPLSAINSFAQGKVNNGLATTSNFLINSTVGIGGIFDVAQKKNIKYNKEDFGQTLAHYGAKPGPFLVIPILGPSNLRDAGGLAADTAVSFTGFNAFKIGGARDSVVEDEARVSYTILAGLDKRESLIDVIDSTRRDAFDLYAAMRSLYLQNRNSKIEQ